MIGLREVVYYLGAVAVLQVLGTLVSLLQKGGIRPWSR